MPVRLTRDDRFCLDGQLLKHRSGPAYGGDGSVYGTEISSFQRIESKGGNNDSGVATYTGPEHFIVKDKAGLVREYGKTSASRLTVSFPGSSANVIKQWSLNRISDRFGNYIKFDYEKGAQDELRSYWPKQISWHNRNNALVGKVVFEYEERPDISRGYDPLVQNGSKAGNSLFKRLKSVKVYAVETAVREYRIEYRELAPSKASAIESIRLCDANGRCMPPTQFSWSNSSDGLKHEAKPLTSVAGSPLNKFHIGDFNGDGRRNIIYFSADRLYYFDAATETHVDTGVIANGFKKDEALVFDINQSGREDILIAGSGTWHVIRHPSDMIHDTGVPSHGWDRNPVPIDMDNDGYPELVFVNNGGLYIYKNNFGIFDPTPIGLPAINVAPEQRIIPIEYDGDGRTDFLLTAKADGTGGRIFVSQGHRFFPADLIHGSEHLFRTKHAIAIDVNGDGLTDLVAKGGPGAANTDDDKWYTFINVGGRFVPRDDPQYTPVNDDNYAKTRSVDWNRDGKGDLLIPKEEPYYTWWTPKTHNMANDQWEFAGVSGFVTENQADAIPVDYNGDGLTDMLTKDAGEWHRRDAAGGTPGLLVQIRNGFDDRQTITYWNLSQVKEGSEDGVYLGHNEADVGLPYYTINPEIQSLLTSREVRYLSAPIPVVSSIETGTGIKDGSGNEGVIKTTYRYAGALLDATGRGFLGFRMMKVKNSNTGIETVNIHRLEYPYTGMIERALQKMPDEQAIHQVPRSPVIYCDDYSEHPCGFELIEEEETVAGTTVSESTNTFSQTTNTADGGIFPYVATTTEKSYQYPWVPDNNPPLLRETETEYVYGVTQGGKVTGDPTKITVSTKNGLGGDEHTVVTDNIYGQNLIGTDWCLGRLTESTVSHTRQNYLSANTAPLSRSKQAKFGYEMVEHVPGLGKSCRLNYEETDANHPDVATAKAHQFDAFGNTEQTTVTAPDSSQRITTQSYDHLGLFPLWTQNALGHREHYEWDRRFGAKRASTGPNGLTTWYTYDGFGRPVTENSSRPGVSTAYDYQWCTGNCVSKSAVYFTRATSTVGTHNRSVTEYDSLGREVASYAPRRVEGNIQEVATETVYDSLGRPYLASQPFERNSPTRCWNYTRYDLLGRPTSTSQPVATGNCRSTVIPEDSPVLPYGNKVLYSYDGLGTVGDSEVGIVTTVTDALGRTKSTVKNVLDRTLAVQDGDDSDLVTYFDYDALGNTSTVEAPDSGTVLIEYDVAGNKVLMNDPDMGVWTYGYTGFGELEWQQDAEGNRVEMIYDALGRMVEREDLKPGNVSDKVTRWAYDSGYGAGVGKPSFVMDSSAYAETYAYNEYGQTTDTVKFIDGQVYWTSQNYDNKGRPDILVYPDVENFSTSAPLNTVTVSVNATSTGTHTVSWTKASPYALYKLYRTRNSTTVDAENGTPVYVGPLSEFEDTVTQNGTYRYWVKSCHATTCELAGPAATAVTLPPPSPAYLEVEPFDADFDGKIALNWGASSGATEYRIFVSDEYRGNYSLLDTVQAPATSKQVSLPEGEHHLKIAACAASCSKPTYGSNPANLVDRPPQANTPTVNPVITGDLTTSLSWTPVDDPAVQYYEIDVILHAATGQQEREDRIIVHNSNSHTVEVLEYRNYHFVMRACKTANGVAVCGDDSSASAVLDSGEKPADYPSLDNPSSVQNGSVTLTFENTWPKERLELQEATNAEFTAGLRELTESDLYYDCDPEDIVCRPSGVLVMPVTNGKKWYRIRACNEPYGCSAWTRTASYTDVRTAPPIPESVTLPGVSSDGNYAVSWEAPETGTVDEYQLYEVEKDDFWDFSSATPPAGVNLAYSGTSLNKAITGKQDGERYYYGVRACYKNKCSAFQTPATGISVIYPPDPPDILYVPGTSTDGSIDLMWTAVPGITKYEVEEFTDPDLVHDEHAVGVSIEPEVAPCQDMNNQGECNHLPYDNNKAKVNGRDDGTTYYYRVRARNGGGVSDWTVGGNGTEVLFKPKRPSSITVPPDSSTGSYTVTWGAASGIVERYELWEATDTDFVTKGPSPVYSGPNRSLGRSKSDSDARYYYQVTACNASGCSDPRSGSKPVHVLKIPGRPGSITLQGRSYSSSYNMSWGAASGTVQHYKIIEATNSGFTSNVRTFNGDTQCAEYSSEPGESGQCVRWTPATSVAITGRSHNKTYYYRVYACNKSGCSSNYRSANILVDFRPGVPSSISKSVGASTAYFTVSWGSSSGIVTKYQLHQSVNGGSWSKIYDGTSRTTGTLYRSNGTYTYRVRACNGSYCSGYRDGLTHTVNVAGGGWCDPRTGICYDPQFNPDPVEMESMGAPEGEPDTAMLEYSRSAHELVSEVSAAARFAQKANNQQDIARFIKNVTTNVEAANGNVLATIAEASAAREIGLAVQAELQIERLKTNGKLVIDTRVLADNHEVPASQRVAAGSDLSPQTEPALSHVRNDVSLAASLLSQPGYAANDSIYEQAKATEKTPGANENVAVFPDRRVARLERREIREHGDVVAFNPSPSSSHHAAMAAGKAKARHAARQGGFVKASYPAPTPVEPLRQDPRINPGASSTSSSKSGSDSDGGFTVQKFGETNEPEGTYAHAVKHIYDPATGTLRSVRECPASGGSDCTGGQVYWEAKAFDVNGALITAKLGNGLSTHRDINPVSGVLNSIHTGTSNAAGGVADANVQMLAYQWDLVGNLTKRHDQLINGGQGGGFEESFEYDALYRLKSSETEYNIVGLSSDKRHNFYEKNGNLRCFNTTSSSCSGDYSYHGSKLHAVTQKSGSGSGAGNYSYNLNGSMTSGGAHNRSITWTTFNKVSRIQNDNGWAEFAYDSNRARYKQETATRINYYIGAAYERDIDKTTGEATHRFHIFAGSNAVAVYSCSTDCGRDPATQTADDTYAETLYLHRDHLGSITVITDGYGTIKEQFSYTAWGKQTSWNPNSGSHGEYEAASSGLQKRGYTGHEMLNDFGLIHMNGRIYDQNLGRFISADPFVQFPESTQGYNRYTYVGNNPLNATDPSGYFKWSKFRDKWLKPIVAVVAAVMTYGAVSGYLATTTTLPAFGGITIKTLSLGAQMAASAAAGFVGGGIASGTLKGAVRGAAAGAITGAGQFGLTEIGTGSGTFLSRTVVSGATGCAAGVAAGGDCSRGMKLAVAADWAYLASKALTNTDPTWDTANREAVVKPNPELQAEYAAFNGGDCPLKCDVVVASSNNVGRAVQVGPADRLLVGHPMSEVLAEHGNRLFPDGLPMGSEGSPFMQGLGRNIVGFNSNAVFHDKLMGAFQRMTGMKGVAFDVINAASIAPAFAFHYGGLGLYSYRYYYDELADGNY